MRSDSAPRCFWVESAPVDYTAYHDEEWGFPVGDDRRLFEKLCLEGFQAGLSWITILRKREAFRRAFAGFDHRKVARFDARRVERLLADALIVRHRGKIEAVIANARALPRVTQEWFARPLCLGFRAHAATGRRGTGPDERALTDGPRAIVCRRRFISADSASSARRRCTPSCRPWPRERPHRGLRIPPCGTGCPGGLHRPVGGPEVDDALISACPRAHPQGEGLGSDDVLRRTDQPQLASASPAFRGRGGLRLPTRRTRRHDHIGTWSSRRRYGSREWQRRWSRARSVASE